jgi:hypothetical protein
MLRRTIAALLLLLLALFAACNGSVGSPLTTANDCASLVSCCASLATGGAACLNTAESNVAAACSTALADYTALGVCGAGTGPGSGGTSCASLAVCCAAMSPALASGCDAIVTAGINANCASVLAADTMTGACASSPGSGPGTSSGSTFGTGPGTSSTSSIGSTVSTGPGSSGTGPGSGTGTGTGTGDAGKVPECAVPTSFPSGGSCVSVVAANDAGTGIQCNPVTNVPCASGYACDLANESGSITGFQCYPPPNTGAVCGTCDGTTTFCVGGATCYMPTGATTGTCAHYCCTNADCGPGTCTTGGFAPASSAIGICTMP